MGKLDGKVALITGGNSGIGLESAKLFDAEGAAVIVTGRRSYVVQETVREIGHDAVGFVGNFASLEDHERLVAFAKERFGRIDIYFANAGVISLSTFQEATVDMFDQTFAINVRGSS